MDEVALVRTIAGEAPQHVQAVVEGAGRVRRPLEPRAPSVDAAAGAILSGLEQRVAPGAMGGGAVGAPPAEAGCRGQIGRAHVVERGEEPGERSAQRVRLQSLEVRAVRALGDGVMATERLADLDHPRDR